MRSLVNQKLYFARLMLDQAEQTADRAVCVALLQAAVFHLAMAYRCYLREIGDERLSADIADARAALRQLGDRAGPELAELALLEQGSAWPASLLAAFREACTPHPAVAPARSSGIPVADITAALTPGLGREWLRDFQLLLDEQRERAQEW